MPPKVALITGASEGLGRTFAYQLAQAGYQTINVARNKTRLEELVSELGDGHNYFVADLSEEFGVNSCVELIQKQHIDILINNAGFSQFGIFRESNIEDELKILNVNCHAVIRLSHAFLKQAETGDSLINLSSITNYLTTPIQPMYCATKCFIASFSESLWFQERSRGVYIQALLPGITKTQFMQRSSNITGLKMKFLDWISQAPESVVSISLKASQNKKGPIVIPGIHNKIIACMLRVIPRKVIVWMMGKVGEYAE